MFAAGTPADVITGYQSSRGIREHAGEPPGIKVGTAEPLEDRQNILERTRVNSGIALRETGTYTHWDGGPRGGPIPC